MTCQINFHSTGKWREHLNSNKIGGCGFITPEAKVAELLISFMASSNKHQTQHGEDAWTLAECLPRHADTTLFLLASGHAITLVTSPEYRK